MIASERSLPSPHQSQSQQQRRPPSGIQGNARSRNGNRPPVRPVKIYVIDPRTLQQRLEAYVGQKQAQAEREKANEDKNAVENGTNESSSGESSEQISSSLTPPCTAAQQVPTVPLVPPQNAATITSVPLTRSLQCSTTTAALETHNNSEILSNGHMTLKSVTSPSFGATVVVPNGVTLYQPTISQSSIHTSGLYIPISSCNTNIINPTSNNVPISNAQSEVKAKSPSKRKKKKVVKKRKLAHDKDKDDEDDTELAYLLKETTTRIGRVSKPVSHPTSPAFSSIAANPIVPNSPKPKPTKKRKKVESSKNIELLFRCESCLQVFNSKDKLNAHFEEFPVHLHTSLIHRGSTHFQSSTKDQQATTYHSGFESNKNLHANPSVINNLTQQNGKTLTLTTSSIDLLKCETNVRVSSVYPQDVPVTTFGSNLSSPMTQVTSAVHYSAPFTSANLNLVTSSPNPVCFVSSSTGTYNNLNHGTNVPCSNVESALINSLVPTSGDPAEAFPSCISAAGVVPSSYSIPSSPPSQCQSPGLPDNNLASSFSGKERISSPSCVCNSPVDPMLLRSRSPFAPQNIPDSSMHCGSVSNLSIPEESLCKGELFMDLGDGILENSNLSAISPFCSVSGIEQLFSEPSPKQDGSHNDHSIEVPNVEVEEQEGNTETPSPQPQQMAPSLLENTEDANDGEIFHARNLFVRPSVTPPVVVLSSMCETNSNASTVRASSADFPKTPSSTCLESDVSMDSSETGENNNSNATNSTSIWQFVKSQIKHCGISQVCDML